MHREQSENAFFFDPALPRQLADLLDGFSPAGPEERLTLAQAAVSQASVSASVFAHEFANLAERTAKRK